MSLPPSTPSSQPAQARSTAKHKQKSAELATTLPLLPAWPLETLVREPVPATKDRVNIRPLLSQGRSALVSHITTRCLNILLHRPMERCHRRVTIQHPKTILVTTPPREPACLHSNSTVATRLSILLLIRLLMAFAMRHIRRRHIPLVHQVSNRLLPSRR